MLGLTFQLLSVTELLQIYSGPSGSIINAVYDALMYKQFPVIISAFMRCDYLGPH